MVLLIGSRVLRLDSHMQQPKAAGAASNDITIAVEGGKCDLWRSKRRKKGLWPLLKPCWKLLNTLEGCISLACIFCLGYIVINSFAPAPVGSASFVNGTYVICPYRPHFLTVCAEEWYTILLLGISRTTAYTVYPLMMLLFLSKANHLRSILQRSYYSIYFPFFHMHDLHARGGIIVGYCVVLHAVAHISRWASRGEIQFLVQSQTGVSGLICVLLTPLITLPMAWERLRKRIPWEVRKALHYLSIVWGVVICFHAPVRDVGILMGIPVGIYLLDFLVGCERPAKQITERTHPPIGAR